MIISSNPNFPSSFKTNYIGTSKNIPCEIMERHLYAFKTTKKIRYLIYIEKFDYDIYIMKFFPENYLYSDKKFNVILNKYESFRIISTCLNTLFHVKENINKYASFGFIGARKPKEESDNNTQRFRIYMKKGQNYFNPDHYIHVQNIENSSYLILDKNIHTEEDIPKIQEMFEHYYLGL